MLSKQFYPPLHLFPQVPPHLCPYMIGPTRLCPETFVPRHICAQTRLCPDTFDLCPDTFMSRHISAPTRIIVADTIMSLVNNNIVIVSTRLIVNLIGENTSMLNCCWRSEVKCYYLTTVQQSPAVFLLEYFVILL